MERQAFTVLPPLSPRLPPPPVTPAASRVAPRAVAHKEASAFVILGEIKIPDGPGTGATTPGRVSPFRGSGFRAPSPPSSKIPVLAGKSAPASPVRKTPASTLTNGKTPTGGKSVPTSPKKTITTSNKQSTLPRKRGESPSKVPISTKITNGAPTIKEPANNKRVTAKPPIPKSPRKTGTAPNNINVIGPNLKPPQPAKRTTADGKPAPAARTRLNNKPVSTEVKAGSVSKDRFSNSNNGPKPAVRKTLAKGENDGTLRKSKREKKTTEVNNNNSKEEEMNRKNIAEEVKSTAIHVDDDDIVNKVVTVTETIPEMHKLNIEINGVDEGPDSITVVELITPGEDVEIMPMPLTPKAPSTPKTPEIDKSAHHSPSKTEANGSLPVEATVLGENRSSAKVDKLRNGMSVMRAVNVKSAGSGNAGDVAAAVTAIDEIVEETRETVQGPAEVEVDAGNHTVTFRFKKYFALLGRPIFRNQRKGKTKNIKPENSPEIHPVSPRVPSKNKGNLRDRLRDRMCGCCRRGSGKVTDVTGSASSKKGLIEGKGVDTQPSRKWYSKLCKWKKEPPPPRLSKPMKAKGESFLSKLNCFKKTGKMKPRKPPVTSGSSCWRKLFCLDRACCAKCIKKPAPAVSGPPTGTSRMEMKRSSSVPAPPKVTGLPKLDAGLVEHASVMKGAIPCLPICLAWMCLILNILIPGTGTVISGFLCMCFGKPRFSVNDSGVARLGSLCINLIVGISQIFTIIFCFVGWGWSIWWGVIMVKISRKSRRIKAAEKATAEAGGNAAPLAPAAGDQKDVEKGIGGGGGGGGAGGK